MVRSGRRVAASITACLTVSHALIGRALLARIATLVVGFLHRGQRAASHARCSRSGHFTTVAEHMLAAHR